MDQRGNTTAMLWAQHAGQRQRAHECERGNGDGVTEHEVHGIVCRALEEQRDPRPRAGRSAQGRAARHRCDRDGPTQRNSERGESEGTHGPGNRRAGQSQGVEPPRGRIARGSTERPHHAHERVDGRDEDAGRAELRHLGAQAATAGGQRKHGSRCGDEQKEAEAFRERDEGKLVEIEAQGGAIRKDEAASDQARRHRERKGQQCEREPQAQGCSRRGSLSDRGAHALREICGRRARDRQRVERCVRVSHGSARLPRNAQ